MPIKLENFIDGYLEITKELESPTSYLKWGAMSCISAVLRDNVWFKFPNRKTLLYPNLYLLLLGDTGLKKANAMTINKDLLREVNNTKVMAGSASMQGVLKELGRSEQGKPKGGSGIMIASELDGFLIKDPQAIGILTDVYDYHALYDKSLSSQEIPPIRDLCISIFAGSNEVMLRRVFDKDATLGGLIGRFIIIEEHEKRLINSGFEDDASFITDEDWKPFAQFLQKLSTISKGPMKLTEPARQYHNSWYHDFEKQKISTKTGFENRLQSHIFKLAMILAASEEGFNYTVDLRHIKDATVLCTSLIPTYKRLGMGTGVSPQIEVITHIAQVLLRAENNHMLESDLLVKLYGNVDAKTWEDSKRTLIQAGLIIEKSGKNGIPGVQMTDKFREMLLAQSNGNLSKSVH